MAGIGIGITGCECCGPPDCSIATATLGGAGFTESAGTWTVGGAGIQTTDDHASLSLTRNNASDEEPVAASMNCTSSVVGDQVRLAVSWLDNDNYVALELEVGDATTAAITRVVRRSAGAETVIGADVAVRTSPIDYPTTLKVFYKPLTGELRCEVHDPDAVPGRMLSFYRTVTHTGGRKAACATGIIAGTAEFSGTFLYGRLISSVGEHDEDCPELASCYIYREGGNIVLPAVGDEWTIESGTFTISTVGVWSCTSADGLLINNIGDEAPLVTGWAWGVNESSAIADPERIGLVFDYVDDDNYHVIESGWDAGQFYQFLYNRTGGVDTLLRQEVGDAPFFGGFTLYLNTIAGIVYWRRHREQLTLHGGLQWGHRCRNLTTTRFVGAGSFRRINLCGEDDPEKLACDVLLYCLEDTYAGDAPEEWQVTLGGITQNGCLIAPGPLNGTHILSKYFSGPFWSGGNSSLTCLWTKVVSGLGESTCPVGLNQFVVMLAIFDNKIHVKCRGSGSFTEDPNVRFELAVTDDCDLSTVSSSMTNVSAGNYGFDFSAATCTLTALP